MAELPRAGIRRLIEAAGAERMSKKAVITHSGRKTTVAGKPLARQMSKKLHPL